MLIQHILGETANAAELQTLAKAAGGLDSDEWTRIPQKGEVVPLQWKHNLGQGGQVDTAVAPQKCQALGAIALAAANAVGIRFCSADVVEVDGEGLMIMEI